MTTGLPRQIGFIGTGIMGGHMARRLCQAGLQVAAWNRSKSKVEALSVHGIRHRSSAADAALDADVVISMLSDGPTSNDVLLGANGVVNAMREGSTLVVMSSIPVETARQQALAAAQRGVNYVDAPVSGGEVGARDGTLSIMVGGDVVDVSRLAQVFAVMGRVTHIGPVGCGQLAKLANQLVVASTICAVAEALLLAQAAGADPAKVREALIGGFADSTVLHLHGKRMVVGDFVAGGPSKYQVKDARAAMNLAKTRGLTLPLAQEADRLFSCLVEEGGGDLDHSAVILTLKRMNGLIAGSE